MNLFQLIHTIKNTAGKANLVSSVKDGDVYENLNSGTQTYPVVNVTIDNITKDETGTSSVTMNIFYIDRLEDNNRNKTQVQSSAVTVLEQIMNKLEDEQAFDFTSKTFYPFTEKFADLCAGSYVTCTLELQLDTLCDNDSFEPKSLDITQNGTYDVAGYDEANVNVGASGAIDYYWIMPHNYGAPSQITYSDIKTTLEIKFRLESTANQSIYDDGYTSLIYEDNQYKARLNGGEWKDTFIRETDVPETKVVKLTGTKLQIGYYLFDLEDGGHKWSYGQRMYIGKGENVGDIDIYYCKLYWDKGDFADYEPFVEKGETVLKDAVGGTVLSIKKITILEDDQDGWWNKDIYNLDTKISLTSRNDVVELDFIPLMEPATNSDFQYVHNKNQNNENTFTIRQHLKKGAITTWVTLPAAEFIDSEGNQMKFDAGIRRKVKVTSGYSYLDGVQSNIKNSGSSIPTGTLILNGDSNASNLQSIIYNFKIIKNGQPVIDLVPKKVTGTNIHLLWDNVSGMPFITNIYDDITSLSLDYDKPSDFQTLTVSNEEYDSAYPALTTLKVAPDDLTTFKTAVTAFNNGNTTATLTVLKGKHQEEAYQWATANGHFASIVKE